MLQEVLPLFDEEASPEPSRPAAVVAPRGSARRAPLWLAVELPRLALAALGCDEAAAVAVVETRGGRSLILCASALASEAGVVVGMPMNAALAICPSLRVEPRQPLREQLLLARLAALVEPFSAEVSLDGAQLLLEVGGSLKLFGGLRPLLDEVKAVLAAEGIAFSLAVAPTALAATLLARHGGGEITTVAALRPALGKLPVTALPLDAKVLKRLTKIGVTSLADLWRLPRDGLARRFGPALLVLLDRALGERADPRARVEAPLRFERDIDLYMESESQGELLAAAELLLDALTDFLQRHDAGVNRFRLKLFHLQRSASEVVVGARQLSRERSHLLTLLEARLSRFTLPAPVISLALEADEILPYVVTGPALFAEEGATEGDWSRLLDELRSRLGDDAVRQLALADDHRPEKGWCYGAGAPTGAGVAPPRPLWLLPRPRPLGSRHWRLLRGPERIEAGWWEGRDVRRDYYVGRAADGRRLWLFRDLDEGRWYLHGLFG